MSILFGHPTGNPNSHHAALAHYEAGRLEAFCVPWFPSDAALKFLKAVPGLGAQAARLSRRRFRPLVGAPMVQGRSGELRRLFLRSIGRGGEELSYEANDWLMETMAREAGRASVSVVHAYEDCALWQFEEAKRRGKACLYDMPIAYYSAWEALSTDLLRKYGDWVGPDTKASFVRPAQKAKELALADLILAPSKFVAESIQTYAPKKNVHVAPYGVDAALWRPRSEPRTADQPLKFLFVGQCSIRKGIPVLLEAWRIAAIKDATLDLVGAWGLADAKRRELPPGVTWRGPMDQESLRRCYRTADVFVFPTFFEGRALVVGEAMACGLPVITTPASGADDLVQRHSARIIGAGNPEELAHALRWYSDHRSRLPEFSEAARRAAEEATWRNYRNAVSCSCATLM